MSDHMPEGPGEEITPEAIGAIMDKMLGKPEGESLASMNEEMEELAYIGAAMCLDRINHGRDFERVLEHLASMRDWSDRVGCDAFDDLVGMLASGFSRERSILMMARIPTLGMMMSLSFRENPLVNTDRTFAALLALVARRALNEAKTLQGEIEVRMQDIELDCPFCGERLPNLRFLDPVACACGATATLATENDQETAIRGGFELLEKMLEPGMMVGGRMLSLQGITESPFENTELAVYCAGPSPEDAPEGTTTRH